MIDAALDSGAIHFPIAEKFLKIIEFASPQNSTGQILAADGLPAVKDENPVPFNPLFEKLEGRGGSSETGPDNDDIKVGLIVHGITSGNLSYL